MEPEDTLDLEVDAALAEAEPEKSLEALAPVAEEAKWYDVAGASCPTCGFPFTGCHDDHVEVYLARPIFLNRKKFGPGVAVLPREAEHLYKLGK